MGGVRGDGLAIAGGRLLGAAFCLVVLAAAGGCASHSLSGAFEPAPGGAAAVESIVVTVGPDERPLQGRSSRGRGYLALVPFVPYGRQQISPDRIVAADQLLPGDFRHDVAATVVADLRASGVARQVDHGDASADLPPLAYELKLSLMEGILDRYLTCYGLSVAGAFLWLFGAPMSYGSVNLSFELELRDPEGLEIGAETFHGRAGVVELLYTAAGPAYTRKLQDAYHEISPVLREFVREQLERERIAPGAGGRR